MLASGAFPCRKSTAAGSIHSERTRVVLEADIKAAILSLSRSLAGLKERRG